MLGRHANSLFWMFRYLERADNTARLLDTGLRMSLTRDLVSAEDEWRSVIEAAGQRSGYEARHASYTGMQVWNHILREPDNEGSVLNVFGQVRHNAREVRGSITGEVWEAVNDSWLQISDMLANPVSERHVGEAIKIVRRASTLTHGAVLGSMLRERGYHFARAGTFVERADAIARIIDIKYYLLLPSLSYVGSSMDTSQWETILQSVSGDSAYRWLNAGKIDARSIVEFLVLDPRFPRSLAYSHSMLRENLAALARLHGVEGASNELMREADQSISERSIEDVFEEGLHDFLVKFTSNNAAIAAAIAQDYRFHD